MENAGAGEDTATGTGGVKAAVNDAAAACTNEGTGLCVSITDGRASTETAGPEAASRAEKPAVETNFRRAVWLFVLDFRLFAGDGYSVAFVGVFCTSKAGARFVGLPFLNGPGRVVAASTDAK